MSQVVYINFELKYKEAVKNLDEMQKEYTKLEKKVEGYEKKVEKAAKKQGDFGKTLDKFTGGAVTKFNELTKGIKSAGLGFKGLNAILMASVIGAFVATVTALGAAFTQSEEGQEKLQRGLAALGAVTKQVMDAFADFGEAIIEAFTNPMDSLKSLGKGLLKFIINPVGTIVDGFEGAAESVSNFVKETLSEVSAIDKVTKARQKARRIERDLQVERAKANRDINDLRLKAEDREKFSASERIELLRKAQAIEENITQKEIAAQKLLIKAQEEEMALGKNTIQDKDKLAELQAKLINLDTKRLRSQRLLQTQITTATNQEKAEREREAAEKQKQLDDEAAAEQKRKEQEAKEQEKLDEQRRKNLEDQLAHQEYIEKAKVAVIGQTFGQLANILGKNSKAGKAFAIAQALTNTYQGVTEVLSTKSTLPEPFATISRIGNIATVLATGFQAVKQIKSADKQASPAGISASATSSVAQAPAFNIVGAGVTNQLADVIAGQSAQPTRAYVVSNDISTAQELDRNIIEGASIG
jgi:chromosome segregation ATPase